MRKRVLFVGILLISVILLLIITSQRIYHKSPLVTYNNFDDLVKDVKFAFAVPRNLLNEKNLSYKSFNGEFIEIGNGEVVLRASRFIDDGADISGDYSQYKIDKKYNVVGNTKLKYLRIRSNSDSLDNMKTALINYRTDKTAYSIKFNRNINLEYILDYLGIDKWNLIEGGSDIVFKEYRIGDYRIKFPVIKSKFNIKVSGDKAVILIGDTVIMIINKGETNYIGSSVNVVDLKDGYKLIYHKNKFNKLTQEYKDYDIIVKSLQAIISSFNKVVINS